MEAAQQLWIIDAETATAMAAAAAGLTRHPKLGGKLSVCAEHPLAAQAALRGPDEGVRAGAETGGRVDGRRRAGRGCAEQLSVAELVPVGRDGLGQRQRRERGGVEHGGVQEERAHRDRDGRQEDIAIIDVQPKKKLVSGAGMESCDYHKLFEELCTNFTEFTFAKRRLEQAYLIDCLRTKGMHADLTVPIEAFDAISLWFWG